MLACLPVSQEFLAYFDTTVERDTGATALAPNSLLYTSAVLATVQGRAFYEGACGGWGLWGETVWEAADMCRGRQLGQQPAISSGMGLITLL